jgi:hypothetical protein
MSKTGLDIKDAHNQKDKRKKEKKENQVLAGTIRDSLQQEHHR